MAVSRRIGGTDVTTAASARWAASLLSALASAMIGAGAWLLVLSAWFVTVPRATVGQALHVIATLRYGEGALLSMTPTQYLWAIAFHVGVAASWGVVYGLIATGLRVDKSAWAPLVLGVVVGLTAQIVDVGLLAPAAFGGLLGHNVWRENVSPVASWMAHVAFGLSFATFPSFFRDLWIRFAGRKDILAADPRIS
jgi:hypothetical protein